MQKNVNIFRSEWIWASKVGLNNLQIIQRVILLGLTVVLTGISLKTELRFKSYGRLKFCRKKSNFSQNLTQTANTRTAKTQTANTQTADTQTAGTQTADEVTAGFSNRYQRQPLNTNR